jgi:hypothetical protein
MDGFSATHNTRLTMLTTWHQQYHLSPSHAFSSNTRAMCDAASTSTREIGEREVAFSAGKVAVTVEPLTKCVVDSQLPSTFPSSSSSLPQRIMSSLELVHDDFVMIEKHDSTSGPGSPPEPDYLDQISNLVDGLSESLRVISLEIHDHPELQYKEYHAHKVLTEFFSKQEGWKVTPSAYGIDTAFVAVFETHKSGPTVSFNAEYGMIKPISIVITGRESDLRFRCIGWHWTCLRS